MLTNTELAVIGLLTERPKHGYQIEQDIVDQACGNLFDKTPIGFHKALEWSSREVEFVRRAGFSLMAYIAMHAKQRPNTDFEPFLAAILARCTNERNFVKKAVCLPI